MAADDVVHDAVVAFLTVLRAGWAPVLSLAGPGNREGPPQALADWAQANWETIVEATVYPRGRGFLEVYGDGADCNSVGSRVWSPASRATGAIYFAPATGTALQDDLTGKLTELPPDGLPVDRFVTRAAGWYREEPPFDFVLPFSRGDMMFPLSAVRFRLGPPFDV